MWIFPSWCSHQGVPVWMFPFGCSNMDLLIQAFLYRRSHMDVPSRCSHSGLFPYGFSHPRVPFWVFPSGCSHPGVPIGMFPCGSSHCGLPILVFPSGYSHYGVSMQCSPRVGCRAPRRGPIGYWGPPWLVTHDLSRQCSSSLGVEELFLRLRQNFLQFPFRPISGQQWWQ